ncbi:MAG TPA: tetratricopeptide repeat protein [Rhodanobacteraceae bacterium]|nr:tetratricopeptide repeat protein [Rhodanobacteraceae bacterium]
MSKHRAPRGKLAVTSTKPQPLPAARKHLKEAERLVAAGQPQAATAQFQRAVNVDPTNVDLRYKFGKHLLAQHEQELGILQLERAVRLDDRAVAPLLELGQAYTATNRFADAKGLLEKALEIAGKASQAHLIYGTFLHKQGKLPDAAAHFRTALALMLDHPAEAAVPKRRQDFDKPEVERLLWTTLSQLALAGVHAFAAFGTLLGIVREGALLPFDKDLDLGLPHNELDLAARCLVANGWGEVPHGFAVNPRSFLHLKLQVTIDVTGFAVDQQSGATYEGIWIEGIPAEWNRLTRWDTIDLVKATSPEGSPIWTLADPEGWLRTLYGDWRTPDPDFDTIIAARNLCGFSLMTQCYALGRIYARWESGNLRKALAATRHSLRHLPDDELLLKVEQRLSGMVTESSRRQVSAA